MLRSLRRLDARLTAFHGWFDRLPEPTRFLFFLSVFGGWLVPSFLARLVPAAGTTFHLLVVLSAAWCVAALLVAAHRVNWLGRGRAK